ncbi:MAG: PAS domain-containing protein, partial [Comamonadaceae bacterium]
MHPSIDLLQALPAAVLVTQNGAIRFANAAGAQLLGFDSPDSLIGQVLADFV